MNWKGKRELIWIQILHALYNIINSKDAHKELEFMLAWKVIPKWQKDLVKPEGI